MGGKRGPEKGAGLKKGQVRVEKGSGRAGVAGNFRKFPQFPVDVFQGSWGWPGEEVTKDQTKHSSTLRLEGFASNSHPLQNTIFIGLQRANSTSQMSFFQLVSGIFGRTTGSHWRNNDFLLLRWIGGSGCCRSRSFKQSFAPSRSPGHGGRLFQ